MSVQDPGEGEALSRGSFLVELLAPGLVFWLLYRQDAVHSAEDSGGGTVFLFQS